MPIVLGGLEASLRRIAHYDYWDDRVLPVGARPLRRGPARLRPGREADRSRSRAGSPRARTSAASSTSPGTAVLVAGPRARRPRGPRPRERSSCPPSRRSPVDKRRFAEFSRLYHLEHNADNARVLVQRHGRGARAPLRGRERADAAARPPRSSTGSPSSPTSARRTRRYGGAHIPALEQIRWSIQILRGCAAGLRLLLHHRAPGARRRLAAREASVLREIATLAAQESFRGTITDLGGATANMWQMSCTERRGARRLPPRLLRVPHGLPVLRGRPRAARRALREGAAR